ncbi:MAG: type IV pilus modification protein PilV [Zoogloeaceae bacterium]|nr:type IV pilus modification protein PilV [Zoogloeaceae bacterium]
MCHAAGGFSLLEILIAVVVLSIGLLGLVGLQTSAVKINSSAMSRSVAVDYANAMMDNVRTNPRGAQAGHYSVSLGGSQYGDDKDFAYKYTANWLKNLKRSLPQARVLSCRTEDGRKCAVGKGNYHMVCIKWDQGDSKLFEAGTQQVFLLGRM